MLLPQVFLQHVVHGELLWAALALVFFRLSSLYGMPQNMFVQDSLKNRKQCIKLCVIDELQIRERPTGKLDAGYSTILVLKALKSTFSLDNKTN